MKAPCKVCTLVRKDMSFKRVKWCEACREYICYECYDKYGDRAKAAFKQPLERLWIKIKELINKYV